MTDAVFEFEEVTGAITEATAAVETTEEAEETEAEAPAADEPTDEASAEAGADTDDQPAPEPARKPGETLPMTADPYSWNDCTITASVVWLPGAEGQRTMVVGVRNHLDAPILYSFNEQDLPWDELMLVLQELLADLREQLPQRGLEKALRDKKDKKPRQTVPASVNKPTPNQVSVKPVSTAKAKGTPLAGSQLTLDF